MATNVDAERAAKDILRTVWAEDGVELRVPVDPFAIARRLGLKVYTAQLEPGVSGMLIKRGGYDDPEIYLNEADSRNRQRFTCAHELGHYAKRSGVDDGGAWQYVDRRDSLTSRGIHGEEIYANQFAANLLMPADLVRTAFLRSSPVALAFEFGVSADAMSFRLENLGLR